MRRDEFGEMDGRVGQPQHGLQIAQEAVEDRVGAEHHQPQHEDGVAVVMEDMAGVPAGDQFVEALVLNAPAAVAELMDDRRAVETGGHGGGPIPIGGIRRVEGLSRDAFVTDARLMRVDDAQGSGWCRW